MSPYLAGLLTWMFIAAVMVRDIRLNAAVSRAVWIPTLWIGITGSRFVSQWLSLGRPLSVNATEGSPIDAAVFGLLLLAGTSVLVRRRVVIREIIGRNVWLSAFMLFGLLSIGWSEFPEIAIKRFIKALGHPVMALIIMSDPHPQQAFKVVMKRCAVVLLPLSVLFIKYFPQYGRGFSQFTGEGWNHGVTLNKNELGYICLSFGIFFAWSFLLARGIKDRWARFEETAVSALFLLITGWLLVLSGSATALVTTVVGIATLLLLGSPVVSKRFFGIYSLLGLIVVAVLLATTNLYESMLAALGRDPTLTDRTKVWADCIALVNNPLVGAGFESFWLGDRIAIMWTKWWWRPTQAHNGYIETYLNLGIVGSVLLLGSLVSTFRNAAVQLLVDFRTAQFRLAMLLPIILYNYTEAAFKGVHFIWTMFFFVALGLALPRHTVDARLVARSSVRERTGFTPVKRSIGETQPHTGGVEKIRYGKATTSVRGGKILPKKSRFLRRPGSAKDFD